MYSPVQFYKIFLLGDRVTPAIVGFTDSEVLVGLSAKQLMTRKPNSVATDSKGKIAENDLSDYEIVGDDFNKKSSVENVHSKIFSYMKGNSFNKFFP